MARKRTIDRNELMQAIESVARRTGLEGLTIDAVAREAGISKSSVLYDCGSKSALLAEFTRHQIGLHEAACQAARARHDDGGPNPSFRALIEEFRTAPTDDEMAVALLICAGVSADASCREVMAGKIGSDTARIIAEASDKRRILRALLALHGLAFLEYFGFQQFDRTVRDELLDDLMAIASDPSDDSRPA